jgi:hypothetical protein
MRKKADLCFCYKNKTHNHQTNPILTCFSFCTDVCILFSYRYRPKPEELFYGQKQKIVPGYILFLGEKNATFGLTVFHYWSFTKIYHPIITLSYLLFPPKIDSFYHHHTLYDTFYQGLHLSHAHTNTNFTLSLNLIIKKHTLHRYNPKNVTSIQAGPNYLQIWVLYALFLTKFHASPLTIPHGDSVLEH